MIYAVVGGALLVLIVAVIILAKWWGKAVVQTDEAKRELELDQAVHDAVDGLGPVDVSDEWLRRRGGRPPAGERVPPTARHDG